MKRLFLKSLLLIATILFCSRAVAADFEFSGLYFNYNDDGGISIASPPQGDYEGSIIIPKSVRLDDITYSVTKIDTLAFDGKKLVSVHVPSSITTICSGAFFANFWESSLINVTFEPGFLKTIESYAFGGCYNLTTIELPNTVTTIGDGAFANCTNLKSIVLPNSLTVLGNSAFANCSGLTDVLMPAGITSIGDYAFSNCTNVTSLPIHDCVIRIGESAYANTGITSVVIPDNVQSIGWGAFCGCKNLKTVTIKDSNKTLKITTADAEKYYDGWLEGSPVETVYLGRNISYGDNVIGFFANGNHNVQYGQQLHTVTIGDNVSDICHHLFSSCSEINSLKIPRYGIKSIGDNAFDGCTKLTTFEIPESVITIGQYAFSFCGGLSEVTIPNSVLSIGDNAFIGTILKSIVLEDGENPLTFKCRTFDEVFAQGGYIESLYLGRNILNGQAFSENLQLQNVEIGDYVSLISDSTFYNCKNLSSVKLNSNLETIGKSAFDNCQKLGHLDIPNSVSSIGAYAFTNCLELIDINIPQKVDIINEFTFFQCWSLTTVKIPNPVTEIKSQAFWDCKNLTKLVIPKNVVSIGTFAFGGNNNLREIYAYRITPADLATELDYFGESYKCVFSQTDKALCYLYVPKGSKADYVEKWEWPEDMVIEMDWSDHFTITINIDDIKNGVLEVFNGQEKILSGTDVEEGTTLRIVATPDEGYTTKAVSINGIEFSPDDNGDYIFDVTEDTTISAVFENSSAVDAIHSDIDTVPVEYFNLQGLKVDAANLAPGIYIQRQGTNATKVYISK